jgi:hypothetical protein
MTDRPRYRSECGTERPCLYFTCKYNLSTPESEADLDENDIPLSIDVLTLIDTQTSKVRRLPILCEQSASNCVLDYGGTDPTGTYDNLSESEIAEILRIPPLKVAAIANRAISKLKHYSSGQELLALWRDFQRKEG